MPTSDDELAREQSAIAKLQEQVRAARAAKAQAELDLANDVTMNALVGVRASLEAELAELKGSSTKKAVAAGAAAVVDPAGYAAQVDAARTQALVESGDLPAEAVAAEAAPSKGGSR